MSRPNVEKTVKRDDVKCVSLDRELRALAEERVGELYPLVKSFSAYVQLMIQLDHKNKYVEQAFATGALPGRPEGAPRVKKVRGPLTN
jgi:hypothetical protein